MTRRRAAVLALALAIAGGAAIAAAPSGGLLDRSRDLILRQADVTWRGGKHGEVRLIERSSARVVQTLLYSKLLRRVVKAIRRRELTNWPVEHEGHEASARYVAALERAEESIPRSRGRGVERHRPLLIEFVLSSSAGSVLLLEPQVEEADGELLITGARLIEALELPREFVQRDMRLIAEDHFPSARDEIPRLLAPPDPAAGTEARPEGTRDGGS